MKKFKKEKDNLSLFFVVRGIFEKLNKNRKRQIIVLIFLMVFSAFSEVFSLALIIPFISLLTSPEKLFNNNLIQIIAQNLNINSTNELIFPITFIFIFSIFISSIIKLLTLFLSHRLSAAIGSDISSKGLSQIIYQPFEWHIEKNSSELIVALTNSINKTVNFVRESLQIIISALIIFVMSISLYLIEPEIFLIAFFIIIFSYFLLIIKIKNRLGKYGKIIKERSIRQVQSTQEAIASLVNIKLDKTYKKFVEDYKSVEIPLRRIIANSIFLAQFPKLLLEALSLVLLVILSYVLLITNSNENILQKIGILAFAAQKMLPEFQKIFASWANLKTNKSLVSQVLNILNQPYIGFKKKKDLIPYSPKKIISLKDISYSYPNSNISIIKNFNLNIEIGEKIGIVGKTGTGKSTFLNLFMGLLRPNSGEFLLDEKDITQEKNNIFLERFQLSISYIPQDFYIKDGTIIENIAYGQKKEEFDYEKAYWAIGIAQMSDFIDKTEIGLNTSVGERGKKLSGGQKQRLIIARALYKDTDFMILDEATSALDAFTEKKLIEKLCKIKCTSIIVSHRAASLKYCDRIIEINP